MLDASIESEKTQPSSRWPSALADRGGGFQARVAFGSGAGAELFQSLLSWISLCDFIVLAPHLVKDHRVPGRFAPVERHIVLSRPAPQLQLLDEIDFRPYTTRHTMSPRTNSA